ncbi:catalase [Rugosimonospora acidiphila]|uniref:Catalase n=1 Tax=Rugosimonospora acidiphila TaxID=556531 RepID=A0ABP9RXD4_9ACTN
MTELRRDDKDQQLASARVDHADTRLTTDQGIPVEDTDNSLHAGTRGPSLLEDFHLREKVMRFDHERIPERVVHARGSGAYGYFQVYESLARYTTAEFLCDPSLHTPVFVRFSTVQGSRGSADTVRDVRGFATKFYTGQGNFDLVGNNMPVFFIQDGIKFPDVIHAVKPQPRNEIPQGASAHDSFWDFVSQQPETMHHVMWLMSDRAIPRSFRTMQGFGVHTFRLVNAQGGNTFVKFHWTPVLGTHSLVWNEAQKIAGVDPDFNRRDLWESIESGALPEYELGLQFIPEDREFDFDWDLLDPTKIIPEELVPVTPVGKLVLNRNPDNFFAETEQVAFCVGNVVPGIDFTDDPLLQARLFSYLDTQLTRLGGPNFAQLPVNRPLAPVHHHQQDGFGQHEIPMGEGNYHPNTLGGGCPVVPGGDGFRHFPERVDGHKIRRRSETFADHYSQATLFWNSMSDWERSHIIEAYRFELGKCDRMDVRKRLVDHLEQIDHQLAVAVAAGIGVDEPAPVGENHGRSSPALSLTARTGEGVLGRRVAILAAPGVEEVGLSRLCQALDQRGAKADLLAPAAGPLRTNNQDTLELPEAKALNTMASVLYDAVVIAGGEDSAAALVEDGYAVHFVAEAYLHAKPIGAVAEGVSLLRRAGLPGADGAPAPDGAGAGVVIQTENGPAGADFLEEFIGALTGQRYFQRPRKAVVA